MDPIHPAVPPQVATATCGWWTMAPRRCTWRQDVDRATVWRGTGLENPQVILWYIYIYINICGYMWLYVFICVYMWLYVVICGYTFLIWLRMAIIPKWWLVNQWKTMGKSDGKTDDEIWYTVLKLSSGNDCYIAMENGPVEFVWVFRWIAWWFKPVRHEHAYQRVWLVLQW